MGSFQRRRGSAGRGRTVGLIVLVVVLAAGGAWLWLRSPEGEEPATTGTRPDTSVIRTPAAASAEDLPELDASDELVRRMARELSSRPGLAEWLATDDLVRRFVGAVVRVAAGRSPREPLEFAEPDGEFGVRERGGSTVVDSASYRRYDPAAAIFVSLDTGGTAELYRRLLPLFREAYRELGFRDEPFEVMLARAVENLLAVPVSEGPVQVVPEGGTSWEYRDPELEELDPSQKHLLRMGPENVRRVQAKLRELSGALDLPDVPARPRR